MCILYPVTLMNTFIISRRFLFQFIFRFSGIFGQLYYLQIKTVLFLPFLSVCLLFPFIALLHGLDPLVTKKSWESGFSFAFYELKGVSFCSYFFLRICIMNGCWICLNAFSALIDMIMWFFFFSLLIWWIKPFGHGV